MNERAHRMLAAEYARIWADAVPAVSANAVVCDPVPAEGSARWGVSIIARPWGVERALARAAEELRPSAGPRQLVYGEHDVHVTVRTVERYREVVNLNDAHTACCVDVLGQVAMAFAAFDVEYRGLTVSRSAAIARGWPDGRTLDGLRAALAERLAAAGIAGPESVRLRVTAHATLVAFTSPLADPAAFLRVVEKGRDRALGTARITTLELVRYRRSTSGVAIESLATAELGRGALTA